MSVEQDVALPKVAIYYCSLCGWLLRASWLSQELLTTFSQELGEVALRPASKGRFQIYVNDQLIWCRVADEGFPEAKVLKQRVRDVIAPDMSLGHSDRK
ncbi:MULTISPECIES: SelT/SelW/SelH family protein [unclassified Agarivorans]|uniref:SelT/SelW/SelH family protein n=1 Tax=unclassified Agarivorans TaxID=2636026 RepID=UPI0026E1738C|nr:MULTISPECIES: SelT/SelW/SelH family protein [unclassified Agarivorans]MDO6686461.1 SelT/SelW/SelH family protein [Agarivorans sp. 3_MG-2023]MDO6713763.1 SelT/SelW/SelH family protein [Agarivorans sp. 2_MG-2023]